MVYISAIISGILSLGLYTKDPIWIFGFFSLVPLFYSFFRFKNPKSVFLYAVILMAMGHHWLINLLEFANLSSIILIWVIVTLFYALFYGIGLWILRRYFKINVVSIAAAWSIIEWIKTLGPFGNPIGNIALSQINVPILASLTQYGGVFLITFVLVLLNACLAKILLQEQIKKHVLILIGIALFCVGLHQIPSPKLFVGKLTIYISQLNHQQSDKINRKKHSQLLNQYLIDFKQVAPKTLIIAPETIVPDDIRYHQRFYHELRNWSLNHQSTIIFGAIEQQKKQFFNSIFLVEDGYLSSIYQKKKLMPFGEYLPFRSGFDLLGLDKGDLDLADFSKGPNHQPLVDVNNCRLGMGICLESVYQHNFTNQVRDGADLLITLSNHAWFKGSSAAITHLNISRFRCIETGRPMIFTSNYGTSAIISETGKVIRKSKSQLKHNLEIYQIDTLYSQLGQWIILSYFLILILMIQRQENRMDG